ncbi:MAG: DUF6262 family protein [Cyanobacteria bacterium P01_B01_bin.77]
MKLKRNADGLRRNAEKKRQETFEKVDKAIRKLVKDKKVITFNAVAEASGVSKAWLYKEPDVKERIYQLRDQSSIKGKTPRAVSASEASLRKLTATLKARIKRLEAENTDLRRQNEVFGGYVLENRELKKQIAQFEAQNRTAKVDTNQTPTASQLDIFAELEPLNIKINSTLEQLMADTPPEIVEAAMQALKQAQETGSVKNPGGFLYKAITAHWQPNQDIDQGDQELSEFNTWWEWAYEKGLVIASQQTDQGIMVLTKNEQWISFEQAVSIHKPSSISLKVDKLNP